MSDRISPQDRRVLVPVLKEQAGDIAAKLTKERLVARTVQVKVRYSDFKINFPARE